MAGKQEKTSALINMNLFQINICSHVRDFFASDWSFLFGFFKDILLPITLAGFAAYIAYFIFVEEMKEDRKREERKKQEENRDKLIYFSTLVRACIKDSITQKDNIKNHIREINKDDINYHTMNFVVLNDFKRIAEILNLEDYLLAYTNHYYDDRIGSIQEFKQIVKSIDFLFEIFRGIPKQLELGQQYDYERKRQFQDLFSTGYNISGDLMLKTRYTNNAMYSDLENLMLEFSNNHPGNNYDITFYYNYFFIPFNDYAIKYMTTNPNFSTEIQELAVCTRDGKQLFNFIKSENRNKGIDLFHDFKITYKTILSLKKASERLLDNF